MYLMLDTRACGGQSPAEAASYSSRCTLSVAWWWCRKTAPLSVMHRHLTRQE